MLQDIRREKLDQGQNLDMSEGGIKNGQNIFDLFYGRTLTLCTSFFMDESLTAQGGPFTTLKNFANSLTHFLFQYKIQFNIVQLLWNF